MNSYDTDEDFDELERYIIDNVTTDDDGDDIAEDLEQDAVSEGSGIDETQVFISRDGSQWYTEPPLVNSKFFNKSRFIRYWRA